ncbi:MAG: bile acid:sodium symporter family protein [Bifidobacterium sp.]|jgi:BASS family bile acid:Na+ symporter|nr:bile acid:sodium symporter family protein [Bifidobacterium sp.]MCI1864603.1 bile acid:sodium symporter family protein [Bifidobacterium sp.]
MNAVKSISRGLSRYFTLFVIVVAVFSFFVPQVGTAVAHYTSYLLMVVIFGMGLNLTIDDFKRIGKHPLPVILGTVAHYVIMPLIALLLVTIFHLDGAAAAGVILVGCCPSGTSSNVMAFLAGGDVALDVSIGILSTLLAPIMLPLLVSVLAGKYVDVPFASMFLNTAEIVLIPIMLGVLIHTFFKDRVDKVREATPLVSQVAILIIIMAVFAANSSEFLKPETLLIIPVVMLHNLCGYGLGFLFAKAIRLDYRQQKAITFEVGMQDSALGATLALRFFTPQAAIASTIFSVWHNISGSVLSSWWANRVSNAAANGADSKAEGDRVPAEAGGKVGESASV